MDLRAFKIANNTVLFDYVATILGSIIISKFTKVPLVMVTVLSFIIGEIFHYFLLIPTNSLRYLRLI